MFYDHNVMRYETKMETEEDLAREKILKDHINLYYDDYYLKPKKKKSTKVKRSHSKRPGARG